MDPKHGVCVSVCGLPKESRREAGVEGGQPLVPHHPHQHRGGAGPRPRHRLHHLGTLIFYEELLVRKWGKGCVVVPPGCVVFPQGCVVGPQGSEQDFFCGRGVQLGLVAIG